MTTTKIINKRIRGRNLIDLLKAKIEDPDRFFDIKMEITPIDDDNIKNDDMHEESSMIQQRLEDTALQK